MNTAEQLNQQVTQSATTTLYKSHSKGVGYWQIFAEHVHGSDVAHLVITHARSESGKPTVSKREVVGKNIGRSNETAPFEQAELEMASRISKQIDKGYRAEKPKAGAQVENSLGLAPPMLATPLKKVKAENIDFDNCFGQYKLDGHRALFKDGVFYSRKGKPIELPHITDHLQGVGLHLDGELYCHGISLRGIGSLVKKPRPESRQLTYYVYDCISDEPYAQRLEKIRTALAGIDECQIEVLNTVQINSIEEAHQLQKQAVGDSYEGAILRHGTAGYQVDKRSRNLLKLKDYQDAEFEIVDVIAGTPKWVEERQDYLQVAILVMKTEAGDTFEATAPGDMYQKDQAYKERHYLIGQMMTVKYFEISEYGIPQQPVAMQLREDI